MRRAYPELLLSIGALLLVSAGNASARDFPDIYSECGLGAMIAPKNNAVAVVTNVTWDLGTTAISSNISSPDTCSGKKARTAALIFNSYEQLAGDLTSGEGSYLDSLITINGIGKDNEIAFKSAIREDFAKIVANSSYASQSRIERAEALFDVVSKHL